jgi:hypothetical protein
MRKNYIKTKISNFLAESISANYRKGDNVYYKNQYMDQPRSGKVLNVEEYTDGEIGAISIKFENGSVSRLLPYEFKYLSEQPQKQDASDILKEIDNQIQDIVGYMPRQTTDLFKVINGVDNDEISITFVEEVKDGRSKKFNTNSPLKLKGKVLGSSGIKFRVEEIVFIDEYKQESDYNEYINYVYDVIISKQFI